MPIPAFQSFLLPVLELAADGREHSLQEARTVLADRLSLSQADREERLASGARRFDNRVAWAKVYLQRAGLVGGSKRAHFAITDRGRELLATRPAVIDVDLLSQYPEFRGWTGRDGALPSGEALSAARRADGPAPAQRLVADQTPEEQLELAYQSIRAELTSDLLARVKAASPQFFERLVVELLLKMGYGGDRSEAGRAIGRPGDEGIDGVIHEDRLGLDVIYVQAKRWDRTVGRPEIQRFVGALHGKRARKGVLITTGTISAEAREYVEHIDPRVVLIDGAQLSEYMLDLGLGVTPRTVYEVKRIDSDYFVED